MVELGDKLKGRLTLARFSIIGLPSDIRRTIHAVDWRLDPEARNIREELLALKKAIQIVPDNPPKILRVKVGDREFISVRRNEGAELYEKDDNPKNAYLSKTVFGIRKDWMFDQSIGVLVFPDRAMCLNGQIEGRIKDKYSEGEFYTDDVFQDAMEDGILYRSQDWKIVSTIKVLVKRTGDEFYILSGRLGLDSFDKFDRQETIFSVKPDEKGVVFMGSVSRSHSQAELDVRRKWYETGVRFYVLTGGSPDTQRAPRKLAKLVRSPVGITQHI